MLSPDIQEVMIDIAIVTEKISNVMRTDALDLALLDEIIEAMEKVTTQLYQVQSILITR